MTDDEQMLDAIGRWLERDVRPQVPELEGALWGQFGAAINAYLAGDVTDAAAALEDANAKSQQVIDENATRYSE